jgi:ribosome-associated toxin RatA of RatAB toxin-antitoxin module
VPEVTRSVLVAHTPAQMFALIDAVEDYPKFLPWCGAAKVLHRDESTTRATLEIDYRGIRQSFTTENAKRPPDEMLIRLKEGPFRKLEGEWRFTALGQQGCKIEFRMSYEFSGRVLERLIGPVFNYIANNLVEAFVKRAAQIHG